MILFISISIINQQNILIKHRFIISAMILKVLDSAFDFILDTFDNTREDGGSGYVLVPA